MAINRVLPEKDSSEGYETQFDRNADAADLRGVFIQNDTSNDAGVLVSRDVANNLTFTDPLAGTKTLTQLASGSGVSYYEFLLEDDPTAETGAIDAQYAVTRAGNLITNETWKRNDNTLIKTIDYTYTGTKITTEVRKVFAADGTTIVAQVTWTYTYTGSLITGGSMVRNV